MVSRVSPCFSFFLSASTAATYIFTVPTCTATIIPLEPCALNAEIQYFVLRFNKISSLTDTTKREARGERRPKDRVKTR